MIRPSLRLRASTMTGLVAAALALTACSSVQHAAAGPKAKPTTSPVSATTMAKTFTPYDSAGAITATVGSRATGNCWTNSIADPSASTYRCIAGNQILDPCFAPPAQPHAGTVACFTDPWSPGVLLSLTGPLPASRPATRPTPWALELAGGARCVGLTGTVVQVGSTDLTYGCGGAAEAGLGRSAGVGAELTVEYRSSTSQALHPVAVRVAWH